MKGIYVVEDCVRQWSCPCRCWGHEGE